MKKFGIIFGSVLGAIYVLFLALPLILSPILNSFSPQIADMIKESTGFNAKFEKLGIVTMPKLTAGIKAGSVKLSISTGDTFFQADKLSAKISLLPLLIGKIELDDISVANLNANLKVRQDGHFLIEEYIPQPDPDDPSAKSAQPLPFGFKLSNRLPNIHLKNYDITFVDMPTSKKYSFAGKDIDVTDFVLDKRVTVKAKGNITFDGDEQFVYDIKVLNRLMPNISLNDMVFNPEPTPETDTVAVSQPSAFINVIDIFKSMHRTGLTALLNADMKTSGTFESPIIEGVCDLEKLSVLVDGQKLPEGHIKVKARGHNINIDGNLYSSSTDTTTLNGKFNTGKNKSVDMSFKSNAKIHDLFRIVNSLAKSFNYNDLETLSATGNIDSDFNLKINKNKVTSNGYLKIPSGSINYGLYNVSIKDIVADIDFNNMMNIKNISLSILGQPLKIYGTIQQNSDTDLHITADKLSIKGLIAAAGQMQILKENIFNSGTLSMDAIIKGRFDKLIPTVNLDIANVDIKNKPADTRVTMPAAKLVVNTDGKVFNGNLTTNQLKIINPMISLSLPETVVVIGEKDIDIKKAYLMLNNSRIDITGKITDYVSNKLKIDIKANGSLLANDIKTMIPKDMQPLFGTGIGRIPLSVNITGDSKTQDIAIRMNADPSNYYTIFDIAELKGHKTIITSDIKLVDDSARLSNTGIYIDSTSNAIARLEGNISALSGNQKLNMRLSVPNNINMVIPGMPKSNMKIRGDIDITGTSMDPHLKGLVSIPSITIPDMLVEITNLVANLNGPILKGNATVEKLVSGGIVAENIASEFLMKNYSIFYLNNILGDAFDGKISGNISYGITDGKITANLTGSGMNAVKTIEGAAGIKNALSGTLGFKADIATKGATDVELMKYLTGKASFDIQNGKFLNVGRFDTLLYAQNIIGNAVLKTLVTSITNIPAIQNTAEFKTVDGSMTFSNGWAKLSPVRTSGPLMSYYVTGDYNLLNGSTNVIILGRLDEKVVSALGGLGDLSVNQLTSYIPTFGALTGQLINSFTSDPANEKTENIPALSTGSDKYKDFKVVFNGGIESASSVKSFKWLSKCDTSAIDYKQEVQNTIQSFKDTFQNSKTDYSNTVKETKQQIEDTKQQLKDTADELKNLFKF